MSWDGGPVRPGSPPEIASKPPKPRRPGDPQPRSRDRWLARRRIRYRPAGKADTGAEEVVHMTARAAVDRASIHQDIGSSWNTPSCISVRPCN